MRAYLQICVSLLLLEGCVGVVCGQGYGAQTVRLIRNDAPTFWSVCQQSYSVATAVVHWGPNTPAGSYVLFNEVGSPWGGGFTVPAGGLAGQATISATHNFNPGLTDPGCSFSGSLSGWRWVTVSNPTSGQNYPAIGPTAVFTETCQIHNQVVGDPPFPNCAAEGIVGVATPITVDYYMNGATPPRWPTQTPNQTI